MTPLHDALNALADTAITTEATAAALDADQLHELLALAYDTQQVLKYVFDTVTAEVLATDLVGSDPYPIPSGGTLTLRSTAKRQHYDQDLVTGAFKSRLAETICTGEADSTPVGVLTASGERVPIITLVGPVVDEALRFAGAGTPSFNSWRAGVAKSYGIKLADYSEWSDGKPFISVEGRNPVVRAGEAVLS